jgi:hypothetical protein
MHPEKDYDAGNEDGHISHLSAPIVAFRRRAFLFSLPKANIEKLVMCELIGVIIY